MAVTASSFMTVGDAGWTTVSKPRSVNSCSPQFESFPQPAKRGSFYWAFRPDRRAGSHLCLYLHCARRGPYVRQINPDTGRKEAFTLTEQRNRERFSSLSKETENDSGQAGSHDLSKIDQRRSSLQWNTQHNYLLTLSTR